MIYVPYSHGTIRLAFYDCQTLLVLKQDAGSKMKEISRLHLKEI